MLIVLAKKGHLLGLTSAPVYLEFRGLDAQGVSIVKVVARSYVDRNAVCRGQH